MDNSIFDQLAAFSPTSDLANPYREAGRRANLSRYLHQMSLLKPSVLLVGEAAGYRGCARTGVPFTSEAILASEPFFQIGSPPLEAANPRPIREATATIVWSTLRKLPRLPLLWNACPFHPHRTGCPESNRPPRQAELTAGEPFLHWIISTFEPVVIAGVGRQAEKTLQRLALPHTPLRHPSHGGKAAFAAGLHQIYTIYAGQT